MATAEVKMLLTSKVSTEKTLSDLDLILEVAKNSGFFTKPFVERVRNDIQELVSGGNGAGHTIRTSA